jgi:hypothetical protein
MTLLLQPEGGYQFLVSTNNSPYSHGAVAVPGYEVVHATLSTPLPYREGFQLVERHLAALGRPRVALCAIELRCAKPYSPEAWLAPGSFNQQYVALLREWGLFVEGQNPIARTNVAPAVDPPAEQVLHAFSYTIPATGPNVPLTFIVAGSGEGAETRPGETSLDAMREKTATVMAAMRTRLFGLGATWADVTAVGVYTVEELRPLLTSEILPKLGAAARHGVHWYYGRPPISNLELELDLRGVRQEILV